MGPPTLSAEFREDQPYHITNHNRVARRNSPGPLRVNHVIASAGQNRPLSALVQSRPKCCIAANAAMCQKQTHALQQNLGELKGEIRDWATRPTRLEAGTFS